MVKDFGYSYDLIVKDSEFRKYGQQMSEYIGYLLVSLKAYKKQIVFIADNAVTAGASHDAIVTFCEYVDRLIYMAEGVKSRFSQLVDRFLDRIERADEYLYDGSLSDAPRDYTHKEFNYLMSCLDNPWGPESDNLGDLGLGLVQKVANLFFRDRAKRLFQECRKALLDYNDETAQGLTILFQNVYAVDCDYGRSFGAVEGNENYYTSCFDCVSIALSSLRRAMESMSDLLTVGG